MDAFPGGPKPHLSGLRGGRRRLFFSRCGHDHRLLVLFFEKLAPLFQVLHGGKGERKMFWPFET